MALTDAAKPKAPTCITSAILVRINFVVSGRKLTLSIEPGSLAMQTQESGGYLRLFLLLQVISSKLGTESKKHGG